MADGVHLRLASWPASARVARGTVWLLQGRADFIEKYFEVIVELQSRGFAVVAFDWRGQGGSERVHRDARRNHATSFDPLVDDCLSLLRAPWPNLPRPFICLAHSMGANILLRALATDPDLAAGAVLTAPLVDLAPNLRPTGSALVVKALVMAGFGSIPLPGGRNGGETAAPFRPDNLLTTCAERYHVMADTARAAGHLTVGRPTLGWIDAAHAGIGALRDEAQAGAITTPLLVVAGDRDRVTSTDAAEALAARLPQARMVRLDGCAHEVLLETDLVRQRFWKAFDRFVGPLASPAAARGRPRAARSTLTMAR